MRFPPKEEDAKLLVGWLLTIAGVGLILLTCFLGFLDIGLEGFPAGVRSFHELGEVMEVLAEFSIMFCTGAALLWAGDTCLEDRKRANRLVGRLVVIASVSVTLIFILIELGGPSDLLGPGEKTVAVLAEVTETLCIGAALFWIGRKTPSCREDTLARCSAASSSADRRYDNYDELYRKTFQPFSTAC